MATKGGPDIVTENLEFAIDAGATRSYSGSGTSVNSIANANTATLYNGVAYSSNNKGFWDFDGSNDYILTDFGDGLNPSNQDLSYNLWVKADVTHTAMFIMQSNWGGTHRFYAGSNGGKLAWGIQERGWSSSDTDVTFTTGEWYYISITFSGTTARLYANGVLKDTDTFSSYVFDNDLGIGSGQPFANDYYWNGSIAAFYIYYKKLTDAEILQNYNAQKSRFI